MAEQLNFNINVGGNAYTSLGEVKKALKAANEEFIIAKNNFGEFSQEASIAAGRVQEFREALSGASEAADTFNPERKFNNFSKAISGVVGGFAALQGAIGLLGGESKELEKQLLKVQSALALSQGLDSLLAGIKSFKQLGATIQSTTVFTKLNNAANIATATTLKAVGVAAETTAISFKVLKTAIASTGFLLIIVAIGELVSALMNYTSSADKAAKKQKELNEEIVKGTEAGNKAVKEYLKSAGELEELRAKLAGKGEEEILAIRKKSINSQIEQNKKDYEVLINLDKVKASALIDENAKLFDDLTKLDINFKIDQKKRQEDKDKKDLEDSKKKKDEQKKLDEEEAQRIKDKNDRESAAQKVQVDAVRATLPERERAILQAEDEVGQKKLTLIKAGNFNFELVEEEHRLKLADINKKYDQEELDKQKDIDDKKRKAGEDEVQRKKEYEEKKRAFELESQQLTEQLQNKREQLLLNGLNILSSIAGENEKISNAIFAIQKGLEIAKVISSASSSIGQIIASTQAIPPIVPPGVPNPAYITAVALGAKRAAIVKVGAAAQIASIAATSISKFKNGAGSVGGGASSSSAASPLSPQSQSTNISQQSINALGNQAIKAFVVETDITASQQRIQAIKQRARFG